jgi:hypothetical protein
MYSPLNATAKGTLALILAQSVWLYYDSDWMDIPWSSDSIHFVAQNVEGQRGLCPSRPYLAVQFRHNLPSCHEHSTYDEIHRFPRVKALGILLLEIGIGIPFSDSAQAFPTAAARANDEWHRARRRLEDPWPQDFPYQAYRQVVIDCLDHRLFDEVPSVQNGTKEMYERAVRKRRTIFHQKVVLPLEGLLDGTGWRSQYAFIEPVVRKFDIAPAHQEGADTDLPLRQKPYTSVLSDRWLARVELLAERLRAVPGLDPDPERVKIAVLDTGCDESSTFFDVGAFRLDRLTFKDFVEEGSQTPVDTDGHGTHLVSLIMRIAPEADVYVARVAKDKTTFHTCGEQVAKVCILCLILRMS